MNRREQRVLLLTDYRRYFYSSTRAPDATMDIDRVSEQIRRSGLAPEIRAYEELDLRRDAYRDTPVVYHSQEDRGLLYKGFIEDLLLGLRLRGAVLVPRFELFRAHHNKVFMEILRDCVSEELKLGPRAKVYGTLEEFERSLDALALPVVIKPAAGAKSSSVVLCRTREEALKAAKRVSAHGDVVESTKERVKRAIRRGHVPISLNRQKFIAQDYVPGLEGDYKVLLYGRRAFVLARRVREGDFRASGSGLFSWPRDVPKELLDLGREMLQIFDCPCVSFDLGVHRGKQHLLEFQFIRFGNYTLENSTHHFVWNGEWTIHEGGVVLEEVFGDCIAEYLLERVLA